MNNSITNTNSKQIGVYAIVNKTDGKKYIGQSVELDRRRRAHLNSLRLNRHANEYLQNAFNKYGEESFEFTVLVFLRKRATQS